MFMTKVQTTSSTLDRKMLSQRELAERTGWSMTLITRMVNRDEIPHLRIGRGVFFEAAALEEWFAARRHGPKVRAPVGRTEDEPLFSRRYR